MKALRELAQKIAGHDSRRVQVIQACIIGLAAGLSALALENGVFWLGQLRTYLCTLANPMVVLPAVGLTGGLVSGFLVQRFSPTAYGSGIPQVRAFILGAKLPLDIGVAAVKLLAGSIALGSGLFLGREGPTVHMGAAIAAHLNRFFPTPPSRTRQLVAAGAGAGLAAAFNAPLAGVFFVIEELLKDVSTETVGTALAACFVASVATRLANAPHVETSRQIAELQISFAPHDLLFWVLLGAAAGVIGVVFNRGILLSLKFYREVLAKLPLTLRVGLAGLISGLIIASIPDPHLRNFATLRDWIVAGHSEWYMMPFVFVGFFFLTLVGYGSGAPGGLFAPAIVLGSSLGAMVAYLEVYTFGVGSPQTMALVGMGAFFASVARVPGTAVVIIFEITGHYQLVLPLMLANSIAVFVGSRLDKGSVYDLLREYSGLTAPEKPKIASAFMTTDYMAVDGSRPASELEEVFSDPERERVIVMRDDVLIGILHETELRRFRRYEFPAEATIGNFVDQRAVSVTPETSMDEVVQLFSLEETREVPVVKEGKLVGIIRRSDAMRSIAVDVTPVGGLIGHGQPEKQQ
ncbi:MAG: chloride channel protein [Candidatus Obscuribacterales bacterium]|nr:chloride channel protein [Candidatus Obscuribacterales bacterium]